MLDGHSSDFPRVSRRTSRFGDLERQVRRVRRYGLSYEFIGACCNLDPVEVALVLDGQRPLPFAMIAFLSLYSGTSVDARKAVHKAAADLEQPLPERQWRPVVGYEGYEVSDYGEVRRLRKAKGLPAGYMLTPTRSASGHLHVSLYSDTGKQFRTSVHRLVAMTFHGPPPVDKPLACHRNGDPSDNRPENIRWGSHQDNSDDMKRHWRRNGWRMERVPDVHGAGG